VALAMNELQALVTGALMGCAMRLQDHGIMAEMFEVGMTPEGNYDGSFRIRGLQSGEVVRVNVWPDAPGP
jgi:hypothetical protein